MDPITIEIDHGYTNNAKQACNAIAALIGIQLKLRHVIDAAWSRIEKDPPHAGLYIQMSGAIA